MNMSSSEIEILLTLLDKWAPECGCDCHHCDYGCHRSIYSDVKECPYELTIDMIKTQTYNHNEWLQECG